MEIVLESRTKKDEFSPLHLACIYEPTGVSTSLFLDHSADVNMGPGTSPLLLAIQYNNNKCIQLLLDRGADLNIKDIEEMGVLHIAAVAGDLAVLKILSSAGIKVKGCLDKDIYGNTPLQAFDVERPKFLTEDPDTWARCRDIFLAILSKQDSDPVAERVDSESMEIGDFDVIPVEEEPDDVFYDYDEGIGTVDQVYLEF